MKYLIKRVAEEIEKSESELQDAVDKELHDYVENPNSTNSEELKEAVQEYDSADTSLNQIPALFKKLLEQGKFCGDNFDNGGGKYDKATEWLKENGYGNFVYDKYNRSEEHNKAVEDKNDYKTSTISNVLNVIKEDDVILDVLRKSKQKAPITYISVYEGDKSGKGRMTKDKNGKKCWQRNQRLKDYVPLVEQVFDHVECKNGIITAYDDEDLKKEGKASMKRLASMYGETRTEEDLNYYFPKKFEDVGIEGVKCEYDGGVRVDFSGKPMTDKLLKALTAKDGDPYEEILSTHFAGSKEEYQNFKQQFIDGTTFGFHGDFVGDVEVAINYNTNFDWIEDLKDEIADGLSYLISDMLEDMNSEFEKDFYEEQKSEEE